MKLLHAIYLGKRAALCVLMFLAAATAGAAAAADVDSSLPRYQATYRVAGALSSVGDSAMAALMDRWLAAFQGEQPALTRGTPWRHESSALAFGSLMFDLADVAVLTRAPLPSELAPYAHQFAGDMMKAPLLILVAGTDDRPAYIAVNKRPGAPLPPKVSEFLGFVLSHQGQMVVAEEGSFRPLSASQAARQRVWLQGEVARLDPDLPLYQASESVRGEIRSVGSDGMKTLMDRWIRDFSHLQPGVRPGGRWEHLGTLNGFHALLLNATDIAPMGRELWPAERDAYRSVHRQEQPLEIRVARGGFNTPQRTTAQAVFVNERNPLTRITLAQLAAIFGEHPIITRWGQLGLGGEWADRPIVIHMPPKVAPNAMSMQIAVLRGREWNPAAHGASIEATATAIAGEQAAIGFGGFEEGGPGLKAVPVARSEREEAIAGDVQSASSGRYPLTRYMYIRLNRVPGEPIAPAVREFLRYVLSRDAQEPILYSGYFPLTAREAREELAKLD